MAVEVPRDTGPDAPRATWKLNGTLQVTTREGAETVRPAADVSIDLSVDADLEFSVDIPVSAPSPVR